MCKVNGEIQELERRIRETEKDKEDFNIRYDFTNVKSKIKL